MSIVTYSALDAESSDPLCDILTENDVELWKMCTVADANKLIDERQADPSQYPEWQGELIIRIINIPPRRSGNPSTQPQPRSYLGTLPITQSGQAPSTIVYWGGNLGLGDDDVHIDVECDGWRGWISLEEALFNIDRFTGIGRERILFCSGFHFGVDLMACP